MALDPRDFIPKRLQSEGLYDQLIWAVEKTLQDADADLKGSVEKYFDFENLPIDLLELIIAEEGYAYITDILELSESQLRGLTQLIGLVHFYKGTKTGLLLVLSLVGFLGSTTEEWWEQSPEGEPHTFKLTLNLNTSTISATAIPRLLVFVRSYVYPILEELILVSDVVDAEAYAYGFVKQTHTGTITTHL